MSKSIAFLDKSESCKVLSLLTPFNVSEKEKCLAQGHLFKTTSVLNSKV